MIKSPNFILVYTEIQKIIIPIIIIFLKNFRVLKTKLFILKQILQLKKISLYRRSRMTKLMNKKEEIKKRIAQINNGEIPKGYKKRFGIIKPIDWNEKKLKDLFDKV